MTTTAKKERQIVLFKLNNELYGLDIATVREIIRMQRITRVPKAPIFVEGVINLRGKVIPIINMKKRFGLNATEENQENCIVVVDIKGETIGIIVDAVTEVMQIPENTIEPASEIMVTADSEYLQGIAKVDEKMIILLDLEKSLNKENLSDAHRITQVIQEEKQEETAAS